MAKYTDEEIVQAFKDFNDIWKIARSGIIISLAGTRVASWQWKGATLTVTPEEDGFKKDFRNLVKEGIIVREPVESFLSKEEADTLKGVSSTLKVIKVSQATPGQLDSTLKVRGYFMLETNLPLNPKGEV